MQQGGYDITPGNPSVRVRVRLYACVCVSLCTHLRRDVDLGDHDSQGDAQRTRNADVLLGHELHAHVRTD